MNPYELIIFDLDGTLADRDTDELLSGVKDWFDRNAMAFDVALVTNQGGVGLRYWMESAEEKWGNPKNFPTQAMVDQRIRSVIQRLPGGPRGWHIYVAYRYQSKKSGLWSPVPPDLEGYGVDCWRKDWRKPAPGMLVQAMDDWNVYPDETLMVGDREEDRLAAVAATVNYMDADEFFGRKES